MSLRMDIYNKVWVVLLTGTSHILFYSASKAQCEEYMSSH